MQGSITNREYNVSWNYRLVTRRAVTRLCMTAYHLHLSLIIKRKKENTLRKS